MKMIPVATRGYLTNSHSHSTSTVQITGHEICKDRLFHQYTFVLKDGSLYGGGLVELDDKNNVFDKDEDDAVCADHD